MTIKRYLYTWLCLLQIIFGIILYINNNAIVYILETNKEAKEQKYVNSRKFINRERLKNSKEIVICKIIYYIGEAVKI